MFICSERFINFWARSRSKTCTKKIPKDVTSVTITSKYDSSCGSDADWIAGWYTNDSSRSRLCLSGRSLGGDVTGLTVIWCLDKLSVLCWLRLSPLPRVFAKPCLTNSLPTLSPVSHSVTSTKSLPLRRPTMRALQRLFSGRWVFTNAILSSDHPAEPGGVTFAKEHLSAANGTALKLNWSRRGRNRSGETNSVFP